MTRRSAARWGVIVTAAALLLSLALTANDSSPSSPPSARIELAFTERNAVPLINPEGGIVTVMLENLGPETVTIKKVAVLADEGLHATYLGWSECRPGCVAAGSWDPQWLELMNRSMSGTLPITVRPRSDIWTDEEGYSYRPPSLVFRLQLHPGEAPAAALVRGCMKINAIVATLSTGETVEVAFDGGGMVAGITLPGPTIPGYECPMKSL